MKNFIIEIQCQTASFRNPDFQNFHKSLELPPPTTIIGLAGAALGYSPLRAQEFFDESEFEIGIYGTYLGKCKDTWKYNKGIRDMRLYDPGLDGSIIQKEFLIFSTFMIAFSCNNEEAIEQLYKAFSYPIYALTMGNSDSLASIKNIEKNLDITEADKIENCFVQGNVVNEVMSLAGSGNFGFSIYTKDTLTYDLPIRFEYENDYGRRTVSKIETYSLIGDQMKINYNLKGLLYKNNFIPLFSI
ncbi:MULTISPECIES: CRISPR-associated protein Cas5 [unclassified Leeuwenhoekiella]|uniref:CRISPR-associated protein Cas5 n=1 Tax=unclassified Leeuwenhoekiella TaxID=2615029 RepID=UPI000C35F447|nr:MULTISPECIES: CRISPR-associated protein Cas5 [unclassified Leeuwenhoekiella]MAW95674.1 CRISPR-associated protein Cas5 [Leeuwenhoekiella sp.]MBA79894.1 CRISPR-associated protein Cas5 [Leeuwenhoekiella sp.]|tara:strand:- start:2780 stop:3511 length:732 start_codon:yes stop_codon:yes gene_type:complete